MHSRQGVILVWGTTLASPSVGRSRALPLVERRASGPELIRPAGGQKEGTGRRAAPAPDVRRPESTRQRLRRQGEEDTDNAVTDNELTDNAVTDNAVTDNAVTDNAVTDNAVTDNAVTDNAVTDNAVTDNAVTDTIRAPGLGGSSRCPAFLWSIAGARLCRCPPASPQVAATRVELARPRPHRATAENGATEFVAAAGASDDLGAAGARGGVVAAAGRGLTLCGLAFASGRRRCRRRVASCA